MQDDSLPPLVNGENSVAVIQFQNADTISFGGQTITIHSLRIDSVGNLPDGLCWTTNRTNNTVGTGEAGCIKINGTACDLPGQYKLKIIFTVSVGFPTQEGPDVEFLLRLKNMGEADTPIDTNQTFTNPFIPYGNPATGCISGLTESTNAIASISIFPNPLSGKTNVRFFSTAAGNFTQTITTLLGIEVYRKETEVTQGENRLTIDAGNLSAGVYLYSISNGTSKAVKRIVIE